MAYAYAKCEAETHFIVYFYVGIVASSASGKPPIEVIPTIF